MLFLIEYDRMPGLIVRLERFTRERRHDAEKARLKLEIELRRNGLIHEVVLLEAASEEALRKTHRRYFEDLTSLAAAS